MATESSAVVRFIHVARQQRHTLEGLDVPDLSSDLQRELTQKVRRWPGRLAWSTVSLLAAAMSFGLLYLYNHNSRARVPNHGAAPASDRTLAGGHSPQPTPVVTPLAAEQPSSPKQADQNIADSSERRASTAEPAPDRRERARRPGSRDSAAEAEPPRSPAEPIAALTPNWEEDTELPTGTLMVGAKPPCQIYIDGRATGLLTPQRSIELPAGKHRIELVNEQQGVRKTFKVKIAAGKTTRAVVDLLQ